MVAASAARPELVQMLDVAFSRRMCCSRVERVSTKPRRPCLSTVAPQIRPGICRTWASRVAKKPGAGPPKFIAFPKRLERADRDVGAERAGRLQEPERDRLRRGGDGERAGPLREPGDLGQRLDDAEEVGPARDDAGGVRVERPLERGEVGAAVRAERDDRDLVVGRAQVGREDLAVLGVERRGDDDLLPAGDAASP